MDHILEVMGQLSAVIWHPYVLYAVLATGVLFTLWTGLCQYHALTHGVRLVRGNYDVGGAPGAISHFQALSAALSATVGLGNIGGVAVAVALGGPGAVFWMWVVGFVGMALKTAEVTLTMLYRSAEDHAEPHGGPMWVARRGFARMGGAWKHVGVAVGGLFCVTLLISAVTGGNMFQAWNVAVVTEQSLGIPQLTTGVILAVLVALVILGGIRRIGAVAGALVPVMCGIYLVAAFYVLAVNVDVIPETLALIVRSAFAPVEAQGAFIGGAAGSAFAWGMKRALFSNEAGQGSSPIAHAAVRTREPVSEGVVAGLEPFIDTLVVCTLTALVILTSGAWNRAPDATLAVPPAVVAGAPGTWQVADTPLPDGEWAAGSALFMVARVSEDGAPERGIRVAGTVVAQGPVRVARWEAIASDTSPRFTEPGVYRSYAGAGLTSHAFDRVRPGLGQWVVTAASWLFAISTMISWSYYGEQGVVYLGGRRMVVPYRLVYCALVVVACAGLITTDEALDVVSSFGTGVMLWVNIPITLIFGYQAVRAYRDYIRRLRAGEIPRKS